MILAANDPTLLGIVCFGGGLFAFFWGLRCFQRKRLMQNTPTSKINSVAIGLAELQGRAVPCETMHSPIAQAPCVYWRYKVEERRKSGKNSHHWATIDSGESGVPFFVEDDTGKILVDPTSAEVDIPQDFCEQTGMFNDLSPTTAAFATSNGINVSGMFVKPKRFTEWHIAPADSLYVFGTVCAHDDQLAGMVKTEDRLVRYDRTNKFFLIADKSARTVESAYAWKSAAGILGGSLLAVVGLAIVLGAFR